jgi:hypothetical protein
VRPAVSATNRGEAVPGDNRSPHVPASSGQRGPGRHVPGHHPPGAGNPGAPGGDSLTRPFAGNVAAPGALLEAGGEVGIGRGWSAVALGAQAEDAGGSSRTGALLGVRYSLLPETVRATQLVLSGGVLRELQGRGGAWARAALGHDEGRARLAVSVHGERIFDGARDAVDVMVTAGASFRLVESLRAGLEYVGQDLEGMVDDDAEGGARHIVGPMLAATLWNERLTLVGGTGGCARGGAGTGARADRSRLPVLMHEVSRSWRSFVTGIGVGGQG